MIYIWAVAAHDDVKRKAISILPDNAPFLSFLEYEQEEIKGGVDLEKLQVSYITQERIENRAKQEYGPQKWFILDDETWKRLLLYERGDFEIFLYLTEEQKNILI